VLQVQDDWVFEGSPSRFLNAYDFLLQSHDVGILQLTNVRSDVTLETRSLADSDFIVFKNDHLPWRRRCEVRPYSDQPHLKRAEFVLDVGPYLEKCPMAVCENDFKMRVANQQRWRVAKTTMQEWRHIGESASFNAPTRHSRIVQFVHRLPGGRSVMEPSFRRIYGGIDHCLARARSR
jgi:hypothetical protein